MGLSTDQIAIKEHLKNFVSNLKANHGIDPTDVLEGDILACFAVANIQRVFHIKKELLSKHVIYCNYIQCKGEENGI